jgi:hypothetical protein
VDNVMSKQQIEEFFDIGFTTIGPAWPSIP